MPSPPNRRLDFDRRIAKGMLITRELTAQRLLKGIRLRSARMAVKATPDSVASGKQSELPAASLFPLKGEDEKLKRKAPPKSSAERAR
jgi:hypothetical protein